MGVLPFRGRSLDERNELARLLQSAKAGNAHARNELIALYIPFILRIASQTAKRYIDPHADDEYSVSLAAFNEAIDRYQDERAASFLTFAETVIRRRLVDFFRAQRQHRARLRPWSEFDQADEDDHVSNWVEVASSIAEHQRREEAAMRAYEIEEYARRLEEFGLSFRELVELSPKHEDARRNALLCAHAIASDPELVTYVYRRKALPLRQVEERVRVSRKTLERQRKYILAMVLLLSGDFPMLKSFLLRAEGD
ncbi:RNA polymerase sigma factor SigI [Alicyclobacillus acidocaldarius]|uniref:RNA polymerase sigma factor SigI n=1 Tax=Alicyclobacillus acidocaldarius TaxID=405212 RepID=UPI0003193A89|nr:RNA polymerase sigma factor SigI [Alicyclobacillus acidocaldarius]